MRVKIFDSIFSLRDTFPNFFPFFYSKRGGEGESNRISALYQQFICPFRNVSARCWRRSLQQQNEDWLQKAKLIKPNFRCGGRAQWPMSFQRFLLYILLLLPSPFYRKPVAQLQCIRAAHPCPGYSLYHFDTNLKFFSK